MPGYTIVNIDELENVAAKFGMAPDLESRFARRPLELEQSGLGFFRLAPGFRFPFGHRHEVQEEIYVVIGGSARMRLDDDFVDLGRLDAVRVAPEVARGFEAGPDGVEMLVFGAPDTGNKDTEMLPDWWKD